jgi:hypothetical protein
VEISKKSECVSESEEKKEREIIALALHSHSFFSSGGRTKYFIYISDYQLPFCQHFLINFHFCQQYITSFSLFYRHFGRLLKDLEICQQNEKPGNILYPEFAT